MTRRSAVVASLVAGAAIGACAAVLWVTASAWTPLSQRSVDVSGLEASPALGAAALLFAASALALAVTGRWAARLAGLAVVVAALLALGSTVAVLVDPAGPARAAALAELGVAHVEGVTTGVAPWAALVLSSAAVAVAVRIVVTAATWPTAAGSRYRRQGEDHAAGRTGPVVSPQSDDVTAWDRLTRGEDPT